MIRTRENQPQGRRDLYAQAEFPFSRKDFEEIAGILNRDAGISLNDTKAPLVYSRLVKRLRTLGIESFRRYCELVSAESGRGERRNMVAALTTNVTRFFRDPHHFEHLRQHVLPALADTMRRGSPIRIWSAGCSTGEEPYSIALTILSVLRDAPRFDVKILATDINTQVLDHARRGVYRESALATVDAKMRLEWFVKHPEEERQRVWRAGDTLRRLVAFRELNLLDSWPMKQSYQVIFCCNVAIYFEEQARAQLWERVPALLSPRGCLYVGHSESVPNASAQLDLEGHTIYRLKAGAA